jgi:hypothetical protein
VVVLVDFAVLLLGGDQQGWRNSGKMVCLIEAEVGVSVAADTDMTGQVVV